MVRETVIAMRKHVRLGEDTSVPLVWLIGLVVFCFSVLVSVIGGALWLGTVYGDIQTAKKEAGENAAASKKSFEEINLKLDLAAKDTQTIKDRVLVLEVAGPLKGRQTTP